MEVNWHANHAKLLACLKSVEAAHVMNVTRIHVY